MDLAAMLILAVVALSVVSLVAMARRRSWNADGSDDARRDDAARNEDAGQDLPGEPDGPRRP